MNRLYFMAMGLTALFLSALFLTGQSRSEETPPGKNAPPGAYLERILKVFDQDGDGKLNDEEKATARRATEQFLGSLKESAGNTDGRSNLSAVLKRFDTNGDGKLSEEEKAAALKGRDAQMKKGPPGAFDLSNPPDFVVKRFDKDGDGKLNDAEKAEARKANERMTGRTGGPGGPPSREEMVKRFDKDGDGKLNETEQAAARTEMEKRRGGGGGAGGLIPGEGKPQEPKLEKAELIKKFDKDGDGKLNEEEKAAAREAFQKREPKS